MSEGFDYGAEVTISGSFKNPEVGAHLARV